MDTLTAKTLNKIRYSMEDEVDRVCSRLGRLIEWREEGVTMAEIARREGISRERVRQIFDKFERDKAALAQAEKAEG